MRFSKILFFTLLIFILGSCEKEELEVISFKPSIQSTTLTVEFDWSNIENDFFDLTRSIENSDLTQRNSLHPGVVSVFNKIANDNEMHHFVEHIYEKLGQPYWLDSKVAGSDMEGHSIVFTPIYNFSNNITAYFVSTVDDSIVKVNIRIKQLIEEEFDSKTYTNSTCVDYVMLKSFQFDMTSTFTGLDEDAYCEACLKDKNGNLSNSTIDYRCRNNTNEWCIELDCDTGFPTTGSWTNGYGSTGNGGSGGNSGNGGPIGGTIIIGTVSTGGTVVIHGGGGPIGGGGGNPDPEPEPTPDPTPEPDPDPCIKVLVGDYSGIKSAMEHSIQIYNERTGNIKEKDIINNRDCDPEVVCNTYNVIECTNSEGYWDLVETLNCITCGTGQSGTSSNLQATFNANNFTNTFFDNPSPELQELILQAAEESNCENYSVGAIQELINSYNECVISSLLNSENFDASNLSADAMNAFLDSNFDDFTDAMNWLIINDPELAQLNEEMANAPAWMWPVVRELGVELIVTLLKKKLNLNLSDEILDALNAINQGDLFSFMAAAMDIITEIHPATKGLKAIWDASILGKTAINILDRFNDMTTSLGDEIFEKVYSAINSNGFNILGNLTFGTPNPLKSIRMPGRSFEDFWNSLVSVFSPAQILDNPPRFQIPGTDIWASIHISTTTGEITINIGNGIKFRF